MKKIGIFFKNNWKFILFSTIAGILSGILVSVAILGSVEEELFNKIIDLFRGEEIVIIATTFGCMLLGIIFSILGVISSKKVNLWKEIKFDKSKLIWTLVVSIIAGLIIILSDYLFFNKYSTNLSNFYLTKPSFINLLSSMTSRGIMEEIIVRLFLMSFFVLVLSKIFCRNKKDIHLAIYIIANILSSAIFASIQIPIIDFFIGISKMIIIRCFIHTGLVSLLYGMLYRKFGLHYAIIAHMGCYIISNLVWLIFI